MIHSHELRKKLISDCPHDVDEPFWAKIVEIMMTIIEELVTNISTLETAVTNAEISAKNKDTTLAQEKVDKDALTAQLAASVKATADAQAALVGMVPEADVAAANDRIKALEARLAALAV